MPSESMYLFCTKYSLSRPWSVYCVLASQRREGRGAHSHGGGAGAAGLSLADVAACFRTLGEKLCVHAPPPEMQLQLVNEVISDWQAIRPR